MRRAAEEQCRPQRRTGPAIGCADPSLNHLGDELEVWPYYACRRASPAASATISSRPTRPEQWPLSSAMRYGRSWNSVLMATAEFDPEPSLRSLISGRSPLSKQTSNDPLYRRVPAE